MSNGPLEEVEEDKGPPLGAVLDFMRLLWAVDHSLQSASKRMESTFGITGPQRLVVRIVGRFPGIAAGREAGCLVVAVRAGNFGGWDQSGAHQVIDTLDALTPVLVDQLARDYGFGTR